MPSRKSNEEPEQLLTSEGLALFPGASLRTSLNARFS
jgi:hypothetical protein